MDLAHRPDSITLRRLKYDDSAERETVDDPSYEDIATGIRSLIAPVGTSEDEIEPAGADTFTDLIFVGLQSDGSFYTIKDQDHLVDEATGDVWIATGPGRDLRDPRTFGGTVVNSHTEVSVIRSEWDD